MRVAVIHLLSRAWLGLTNTARCRQLRRSEHGKRPGSKPRINVQRARIDYRERLMDPSAETTGRTDWPEGLPVRDPGISFWMASTRGFVHLTEGADAPLPAQAATVVIGSGLAGSLATFHLLASGAQNVVMLEARDACSCASARNGGHVRPDPFYGFPGYERLHGTEQARKILENERVVLEELARFVEQYKVCCAVR